MTQHIIKWIAGFFVPGLTQMITGKFWQGATFFVCISASFSIGLITDLDYYYRYNDNVESQYIFTKSDQSNFGLFKRPNQTYLLTNDLFDQPKFIQANGIGRIQIDLPNDHTNTFTVIPSNYFYVKPANSILKVGSMRETNLGLVDTLKKASYMYLRPLFTTAVLYEGGQYFQLKYQTLLHHLEVKNIPSPIKELGFVFIIMACLFNILVIIHGGELCYNSYKKGLCNAS